MLEMFSSAAHLTYMLANSWAVIPLFLRIRFFFLSTFSSFLLTDEYVVHGILSTEVTPLFNLENHPKTYVLPIFCFPDTTFSIFHVSVAVFLS